MVKKLAAGEQEVSCAPPPGPHGKSAAVQLSRVKGASFLTDLISDFDIVFGLSLCYNPKMQSFRIILCRGSPLKGQGKI